MSETMKRYLELERQMTDLEAAGMSAEADEIRCEMDIPWNLMTPAERIELDSRPDKPAEKHFGSIALGDSGKREVIRGYFNLHKEEREATLVLTENCVVVTTKSWLRANDHKLVESRFLLSKETFVMMVHAMVLGSEYFGIDILPKMDGQCEYDGFGVPKFIQKKWASDDKTNAGS